MKVSELLRLVKWQKAKIEELERRLEAVESRPVTIPTVTIPATETGIDTWPAPNPPWYPNVWYCTDYAGGGRAFP